MGFPRTPWYARLVAGTVVAYAFSPIDLIPDPIPVLGYLDDLVIVPLGIVLALKLIPPLVLQESRHLALAIGLVRGHRKGDHEEDEEEDRGGQHQVFSCLTPLPSSGTFGAALSSTFCWRFSS